MYIITALGNPGKEYENTRHNAGFLAADALIEKFGLTQGPSKFHSVMYEGNIAGERVMLLKPTTFMNKSGVAVGEAINFYKLDPQTQLMVLVDDLALDSGNIRIRASGSAGGHNGLIDIERALGSKDYPRMRIGIDARGQIPQVKYVLGRFTEEQLANLDDAKHDACAAIECWLKDGLPKAMSTYNSRNS
ncbi:MAG: aminoacyl-tRNA hydrolase [Phycisphaeraceae bacterium JB051]